MKQKPSSCNGCPLVSISRGFLPPSIGRGGKGLLVMSNHPDSDDVTKEENFYRHTLGGGVLDHLFSRAGIDKNDFALANMIACTPPKNVFNGTAWEQSATAHCTGHREQVLKGYAPTTVLALGDAPLRHATGFYGKKKNIDTLRGYKVPSSQWVFDDKGQVLPVAGISMNDQVYGNYTAVPVIPTHDPRILRMGKSKYNNVMLIDILRAKALAEQVAEDGNTYEWFNPADLDYVNCTSVDQLVAFKNHVLAHPDLLLSYDIETNTSANDLEDEIYTGNTGDRIESVQFSTAVGTGYFVPFTSEFIPTIIELLASPNPKVAHNGYLFDNPVLMASGVGITLGGVLHDTIAAWGHFQPDLKANLQYVAGFYGYPFPWKHLHSSNPALYGCADVDAPMRITMGPDGTGGGLFDQLRDKGMYTSYERQIVELQRALHKTEARGVPMDKPKLVEYGQEVLELQNESFAKLQEMCPPEVKKLHVYKNWPKNVRAYLLEKGLVPKDTPKTQELVDELNAHPELKNPPSPTDTKKRPGEWVYLENEDGGGQLAICKPFLPGSGDQIIEYIRFMGKTNKKYKVPVNFKTDDETSEKKGLERLIVATDDPVLKEVLTYRAYSKLYSTYVLGWMPKEDGRVHTQFTHKPATGQLSSRNPNIQNGPKSTDLADRFRDCIEAPAGHVMCEIDYSAFHVLTTGYCSEDSTYMRLARIDPHSFVASYFDEVKCEPISADLSDDEIAERTAWVKSHHKFERNKQAKPGILGYGFGLGVYNFYEQNREHFENLAHVKRLFALLDDLFPKAAAWRTTVRKQAHNDGYLLSEQGYIRRFGEVYRWDSRKGMLVPGNDSEAAIAFLPANLAFGHIKDVILRCEALGYNEKYKFINTVHDSLWFCCPVEHVTEMLENVTKELIACSKTLVGPMAPEGLWCGCEAEIGKDMNHLKTVLAVDYNKVIHWDKDMTAEVLQQCR